MSSWSVFKKCFASETPYRWLQMRTSDEIDFMLRNTSVSIKEIMLDYHFKTFSHFTTYCKRNLGATPNEIRQRGQGERGRDRSDPCPPPGGRKTKCKLFWIFRRREKRAFLFFCKTNRTALVRLVS